jgi:uncharacterized protein (DUF2267 family)
VYTRSDYHSVVDGRTKGALKGWEKRRERAERVEANLPPELHALWRTRRWAAGSGDFESQTRDFLQYAHDHEGEVVEALQAAADAKLDALVREYESAANDSEQEVA